jgi:hypothetical protein
MRRDEPGRTLGFHCALRQRIRVSVMPFAFRWRLRRHEFSLLCLSPASGPRPHGADVGIDGISIYEGRKHSFATDAVARGVQARHLQAFLGRADVRSTRRYARLADAGLLEVLRPSTRSAPAGNLSRACPTPDSGSRKPLNPKGRMVEAAGIETCTASTESAWFRVLTSTQGGVRPERKGYGSVIPS